MDIELTLKQLSNYFYNEGLKYAKSRDLSNAVKSLSNSLRCNKYNKHARNLYGLVLFERGEVSEAIIEWTISYNDSTNRNVAIEYINNLFNDKENLFNFSESIKQYNEALYRINKGQVDWAMQLLYKATSLNPKFIKANALLALLLMQRNLYVRAGSFILNSLKVDKYNPKLNYYMDIIKKNTKKSDLDEKVLTSIYSTKDLSSNDRIVPKIIKQLSSRHKFLYVSLGIIMCILGYAYVVYPMQRKSLITSLNRDVVIYSEQVDSQNKIILDLRNSNESLASEANSAVSKLQAYQEENRLFSEQYEKLNSIISDYENGYISRATKNYVELDKSKITDENLVPLLNRAKSYLEGVGAKKLCELGTDSWNAGKKEQAVYYYQLSLELDPNDPETMWLLARLYQNQGKNKEANTLFDKIIGEHPSSKYATRAKEARGY